MNISNDTDYNREIQSQETKKNIIGKVENYITSENPDKTATQLTCSQKCIRTIRQIAYSYTTGYQNELMSAEEFKNKLRYNEKFSPDIYYVIYAELPEEKQAYSIPTISCENIYNTIFNPEYYGKLDLSDIERIKLPDNLHVKGSLNLARSKIFELPNKLIVDGNLNVSECENLSSFPESLHVKQALIASKSGIKQLNSYFTVNDCLDVSECIYLSEIPENQLQVGANLDFTGCINIKNIPTWIYQITPIPSNNRMREVCLHNTGINYSEISKMVDIYKTFNRLKVHIRY